MSSLGIQPVKFRLTTRVRCFYISVIQLSLPSDFRENLTVPGFGLGIWLGLHFQTGMLFQDQQNMWTQERV